MLICAVSLGFGWGTDIDAEMQSVATHRQNRGFPKGAYAPLWHTTLPVRCSVLYLLEWLTGETGCDAVCTQFTLAGKRAGVLRADGNKNPVRFRRATAGILTLSPVSHWSANRDGLLVVGTWEYVSTTAQDLKQYVTHNPLSYIQL